MKLIGALNSNNEQLLRKYFIDKRWIDWINFYDLAEQFLLHRKG